MLDSGMRSWLWMILRCPFETTFSPGDRSSSVSDRAKLSPTQLNSDLFEVFSNGRTSTVSVACPRAEPNNPSTKMKRAASAIGLFFMGDDFQNKKFACREQANHVSCGLMQKPRLKMVSGTGFEPVLPP